MRKSDCQITVTKLYRLFFVWKHKLALSLVALRCCWSNTFAKLLWSTWLMWWTGAYCWKFMHPVMNAFFFPAFVQSLQIINKSSPKRLVCSHPTISAICPKTDCLPPFSRFIAMLQAHLSGYSTSTISQTMNKHGRSSLKFPRCVNCFQAPLRS